MPKHLSFSDLIDVAVMSDTDYFDPYYMPQPTRIGASNRIENPKSVVEWCDIEGYDSRQMARTAGESHYAMTNMPF